MIVLGRPLQHRNKKLARYHYEIYYVTLSEFKLVLN